MTAATACRTCGTEPREGARFCHDCGAPVTEQHTRAEYKQVTVLFADVVHSMDIAAAVGTERLREIMAGLVDRAAVVVKRYGGTLDRFTGDGIMAVFGAPVTLEDHAIRACLAALGIQEETAGLATEVNDRDGLDLKLRVGLNSGQVIAGEIGSRSLGYTTIGEQVGLAHRMESVAPPGGVMLSASTARLVEHHAVLSSPEIVHIKGNDQPVAARRLLGVSERDRPAAGVESTLVGRRWEMAAIEALLERSVDARRGAVITVVGSPGIGKSRLVREVTTRAAIRGVEVFTGYCQSHTSDIPFYAVARLLRAATGVRGLDDAAARTQIRVRVPDANPEDVLLLEDLLGIADPEAGLAKIDPDARRRRLTALVNSASLARTQPTMFVIEDAHWIDQVSESMIADFLVVIPQTHSLVLFTYRPEYVGALSQVPGAQSIALAPLSGPETAALVSQLLGPDPTIGKLGRKIAERASGNPFFVEEMVRELAERGVLRGQRGAYMSVARSGDVSVPATLQATIAARIDRLDPAAKRTLSTAAVVGSRFSLDLLKTLGIEPVLDDLLRGQFLDQITFVRDPDYVFHHPLIRTVAYESQLKSDRAQLHRRLAAAIEQREPESADENAALIAEHLEAAGDLHAAFAWHMRAGAWSTNRDITAAHTSWRRARQVADRLPEDDPDRVSMRIAPLTLLSASGWRVVGSGADPVFDELRELCTAAGDQRSLAIGMTGPVMEHFLKGQRREASRRATEHVRLLESIGDSTLTVALSFAAMVAKHETAEMADVLRLAQRVIDLADRDAAKGDLLFGSPLAVAIAWRGTARWCLGIAGWKDDLHQAIAMARASDAITRAGVMWCAYLTAIPYGVLLPDVTALRDTAELLVMAGQSGDDLALDLARTARGVTLAHQNGAQREAGFELLAEIRERALNQRFSLMALPIVDIHTASEKARLGDLDAAIALALTVVDDLFDSGGSIWSALATTVLVEALLQRRGDADLGDARAAIDRLAAAPTDPGFVLNELALLRLRALLARARIDATAYREYRDRYRDMAKTLGFEGHIDWAEAMP